MHLHILDQEVWIQDVLFLKARAKMGIVPENALILVGIMPNTRDMEIARLLGWYRIPMRLAPKIIEVDYYAFYQGARFGEDHRWRIEYITEYQGHELLTRGELIRSEPDHPRAREEYYKIQLGQLTQLETTIIADKWKRISFFYTTGDLFNKARIINDLVVRSEDREVLWKNLRERKTGGEFYLSKVENEQTFDTSMLDSLFDLIDNPNEDDLSGY